MRASLLLTVTLFLPACGGGGGNPAPAQQSTVTIESSVFDAGNVGLPYSQSMRATGGNGNYTWWISSAGDALPDGLSLTDQGDLTGTPTQSTVRSVVVVVQDSNAELATRTLRIETRDIEITGADGGSLPVGTTLTLTASGGSATYSFSLSVNSSGASLQGSGSYTAGSGSGVDVIRATDAEGFFDEVAITVGSDPFAGFAAAWGTSDVWWINWDVVYDSDPVFASDFDGVLADLGFRHASSTGATGTEEDNLARSFVIRRTLGHLSTYYGNTFDGASAAGGLGISFVKPAGPAQGTTPGVGSVGFPGSFVYNSICVRNSNSGNTIGTAYLDGTNNTRIEHDCGNPGSLVLGVFANRLLGPFRSAMGSGISSSPITAADIGALRSLLDGNAPQGAREQALFDAANDWGRILAAVLAHEIGHSLGLTHAPSGSPVTDIMNSSLTINRSNFYAFSAIQWVQLQGALPGPNR